MRARLRSVTEIFLLWRAGQKGMTLGLAELARVRTPGETLHGPDARYIEFEGCSEKTGAVAEMLAFAEAVRIWLEAEHGWRDGCAPPRCRVLAPSG